MSDDPKKQPNIPELADDDDDKSRNASSSATLSSNQSTPYNPTAEFASSINASSPSVQGEQSISGDMPDPESDDDTLATAQAMGFHLDESTEDPKPLNMAEDFNKGEKAAHE